MYGSTTHENDTSPILASGRQLYQSWNLLVVELFTYMTLCETQRVTVTANGTNCLEHCSHKHVHPMPADDNLLGVSTASKGQPCRSFDIAHSLKLRTEASQLFHDCDMGLHLEPSSELLAALGAAERAPHVVISRCPNL